MFRKYPCLLAALCLALLSVNFSGPAHGAGDAGPEAGAATRSGADLEATIENGLRTIGFEIIANSQWQESRLYANPDLSAIITNAPYRSIYGHRARIEFLIVLRGTQILVETKRQNVAGSVDEKLPYVYLNAVANIPEREFVLVMDGDGWKPEARRWITAKAADTPGFYVFTPDAFLAWIEARFR